MADFNIEQLADLVSCHGATLRRLAREGRLPGAYRLGGGGSWRIRAEAVDGLRGLGDGGLLS